MEYRISLPPRTPLDTARVTDALLGFDPAAIVDYDVALGRLRLVAALSSRALADLLAALGVVVPADAIRTEPSVCCGGCGG